MKASIHTIAAFAFAILSILNLSATDIGGTVVSNVTLDLSGSPYLLTEDYIIPDGVTLTINPGVEIQINNHTWDIIIDGTLIADGTTTDHIYVHSLGGNGGGSIALNPSGNSHSIMYCDFENLGIISLSAYDAAVYLDDTDLTMDHCTFTNCGAGGDQHMVAHASSLSNIGGNNSIERVLLLENSLDGTCTWPMIDPNGFSYRLEGDLSVALDETLTIEPGVSVDLLFYLTDLSINGSLLASGTVAQPIIFTSTGGNGGGSISLLAGSEATLAYVDFSNLGVISLSERSTGLYIEEMELVMDQCTFSNCGAAGSRHITADATAISNIGSNNTIEKLLFIENTLDDSCTWPNIDPTGCTFEMAGDQTLEAGFELTIAAGVEIDIVNYISDLRIYGDLQALGSQSSPILLSSSGGNGGGSLALLANSSSQLLHMNLENLGIISLSDFYTGIHIEDADISANFLTFINCGAAGDRHITAHQDAMTNFGGDNSLTDVLLLDAVSDVNSVWPNLDSDGFKYILKDSLGVDVGTTLSMEAGIDVEFQGYLVDLVIEGSLTAIGTPQDSIVLYGPAGLGGGSLVFGASSTGNELKYCSLNKLGDFSLSKKDAGIHTETGNLCVQKSTIRNSKWGIHVISGQPDIANCVIKDNSTYGLLNESSNLLVEACDVYWGDPSGPFHATSNPTGLGDNISDNVEAGECYAGPLEIQCPANITLNVGDPYTPGIVGAVDVCIRDCSLSQSNFNDDIEPPQCSMDMTRMWLVTDICGNSRTCAQTISWIDATSPTIICPPNVTLDCNTAPPSIDLGDILAMDNCPEPISKTFEGENETVLGCLHQFDRLFKVTDAAGNSATCMTSYFVEVDMDPPAILNVPDDITVECDNVPSQPSLTTQDDCSSVTLDFAEQIEGICPSRVTRTWTATDGCGNSTVATQVITVENPCPADINRDGTVDIQDFIQFNSAFGTLCTFCPEDINRDGSVDITDFIEFNSAFGNDCVDLLTSDDPLSVQENNYSLRQEVSRSGMLNLNPDLEKLLHETDAFLSLSLYPVPNDGSRLGITIDGSDMNSEVLSVYCIYSPTGKKLMSGMLDRGTGRNYNIEFYRSLESGVYMIQLLVGEDVLSEYFIVE